MYEMRTMFKITTEIEYKDFLIYVKEENLIYIKEERSNQVDLIVTLSNNEQFIFKNGFDALIQAEITDSALDDVIHGKDKTKGIEVLEIDETTKFWSLTKRSFPKSIRLQGNQEYKYINYFDTLDERNEFNKEVRWGNFYSPKDPIVAEMIRTGKTFYNEMKLADLLVLSVDIETSGLTLDANSEVYCIGNTWSRHDTYYSKDFRLDDYKDRYDMIEDWAKFIKALNPNVIIGHNIMKFDLPYLQYCNNGQLNIGINGENLAFIGERKFRVSSEEKWDINEPRIFGRQIIDTRHTSIRHDISKDYPSSALKPIVKWEHDQCLAKKPKERNTWENQLVEYRKSRVIFNFDEGNIKDSWKDPKNRLGIIKYCQDDAWETLHLFYKQIVPFFYLTQYIPMTFQETILSASGAQLDAFLVRSYLQKGFSIPETSPSRRYLGGISLGNPGIYERVQKYDVASLYPSIILRDKLYNKSKDPEGNFLKMVDYFTSTRIAYKKQFKETKNPIFDGLQAAFKIFINSSYGLTGTPHLKFNDFDIADQITAKGRAILMQGVKWASGQDIKSREKRKNNGELELDKEGNLKYEWYLVETDDKGKGFNIVNLDTDSFSFASKDKFNKDDYERFRLELNALFDKQISWEDDDFFKKFIVLKAKNYILQYEDGKLKIRGSALTDTKKELYLQGFINKIIDLLLKGHKDQIFDVYRSICFNLKNNKFDIKQLLKKVKISDAVLNSQRKQETDILDAVVQANIEPQLGDRYMVYRTIDDKLEIFNEINGLNVNIETYIEKTFNTLQTFENVIDLDLYPDYTLKRNQCLI